MLRIAAVVSMLLGSSISFAQMDVIYGDDNRKDIYDAGSDPVSVHNAESTAILIRKSEIKPRGDRVGLSKKTAGESMNLCKDEPFRDQPNPGFCSGFLVGEDLFVTAGHCITSQQMCDGVSIVFGFGYDSKEKDLSTVAASDVYGCKSIVHRELETGTLGRDYAVVRLDRNVAGREPLRIRRTGALSIGDAVTVIGHPSGLPTKITDGAAVRTNNASEPYFVANLDTYGGNSGSAVFNSNSGEVEGILVRGDTDYIMRGSCRISNRCPSDGCRGEDVTKAEIFSKWIP